MILLIFGLITYLKPQEQQVLQYKFLTDQTEYRF